MDTTNFTKRVRLGITSVSGSPQSYYVTIEWKRKRLSFSGQIGREYFGQIRAVPMLAYAPGWDEPTAAKFFQIWEKWHLNDMQAGTPAQTAALQTRKAEMVGGRISSYEEDSVYLTECGLNPDPATGYRYGSAWLQVDVPADILAWLAALPAA